MNSSLAYRKDTRTEAQFKEDIKECTRKEQEIIADLCDSLGLEFKDNGIDNTGTYLEEVTASPDFEVTGKIEVKFSRQFLKKIRIKVGQIETYKKHKASILYINGINTSTPMFTIMRPEDIEKYLLVEVWGKECYEVLAGDYVWLDWNRFKKMGVKK